MSRDERPYFDEELGIPFDEAVLAGHISIEEFIALGSIWEGITHERIEAWVYKSGRRASGKLRLAPSRKRL